MTAIRPRTACEASQDSKNHCDPDNYKSVGDESGSWMRQQLTKNSKNPTIPMVPSACATNAIVDPNLGNIGSSIGPRKMEKMNSVSSTAAFQTIGPSAITAIRMSGAGGKRPVSVSGNDLTNM